MTFSFLVFCCGTIVLHAMDLPPVIDFKSLGILQETFFSKEKPSWEKSLAESALEVGYSAFNEAPEIGVFLHAIKKAYHIDTLVETGSYVGFSTVFFSRCFQEVHTIEISKTSHERVKRFFSGSPHVHCHLGSSDQVLPQILPSLTGKPIIFYLDAHWNDHWPLLQELEEIGKTHRDRCIIVIDDFKVPERPEFPYDQCGAHECSYQYIQNALDKVFSSYSSHYVLPQKTYSRAKFVAIPKMWKAVD